MNGERQIAWLAGFDCAYYFTLDDSDELRVWKRERGAGERHVLGSVRGEAARVLADLLDALLALQDQQQNTIDKLGSIP